jgi:plastocyanin
MGAIFTNFAAGTITDSPLTNGAGAINSANFASLPAVAAPDFLFLVLDPAAKAGVPEVVKVTAHTLGATTVTVTRGQQTTQGGSVARQHAGGTTWVHALTALDLDAFPYRLVTTKGDLIAATGAGAVTRVPATADQSFLRTDSSQTAGVKWGNVGTVPVHATTAARDAAMAVPSIGQAVYLKTNDVNEGLYFNNSAGGTPPGVYRPAWNLPWGYVGSGTASTAQSGITTVTAITGMTVTWTATGNRRYRIHAWQTYTHAGTDGDSTFRLRDGSNATVALAQQFDSNAGHARELMLTTLVVPSAGSVSYNCSLETSAGTATISNTAGQSLLLVEDIGPSGAPA